MWCIMPYYSIHLYLLASFQESQFYPSSVQYQNIDHVNGIHASKAVDLSIFDVHYLLYYIGAMLLICVVIIKIKNIFNLISATMAE